MSNPITVSWTITELRWLIDRAKRYVRSERMVARDDRAIMFALEKKLEIQEKANGKY